MPDGKPDYRNEFKKLLNSLESTCNPEYILNIMEQNES